MKNTIIAAVAAACCWSMNALADMQSDVAKDYDSHLAALFDHFHRNPELSLVENQTAARMASELRAAGFDVTEGVGGTGVVAIIRRCSRSLRNPPLHGEWNRRWWP